MIKEILSFILGLVIGVWKGQEATNFILKQGQEGINLIIKQIASLF